MNKISLHDLYEIKKKKDAKLNDAFNIILNSCHKKIKTIAEIGGQSLYYTIPPIIIGYPLYDYNKCLNYIINSLRKSGLYVSIKFLYCSKYSVLLFLMVITNFDLST
jgi:hypothetical protein